MNVESSGAYNLTPLCQGRWVRIEASTPWQRLFSWFHTSRAVPCRVLLRLGVAQLPDRNQSCTKMTYSCRMTQIMHLLHSSIKYKRDQTQRKHLLYVTPTSLLIGLFTYIHITSTTWDWPVPSSQLQSACPPVSSKWQFLNRSVKIIKYV